MNAKKILATLALASVSALAHAYNAADLQRDCSSAEASYSGEREAELTTDGVRCQAYVMGVADGYAVGEYLARQAGLGLNAFCLPKDPDLPRRLVRSVAIHLERMPLASTTSTATLVAGALAKSFPCADKLEPKK